MTRQSSSPAERRCHRRDGRLYVHHACLSLALPLLLASAVDAFSPLLPPSCPPATEIPTAHAFSSRGPRRRFATDGGNAPRMSAPPSVGDQSEKKVPESSGKSPTTTSRDDDLSEEEEDATSVAVDSRSKTTSSKNNDQDDEDDDPLLSTMPWSDFQSWALRDNLPRYVVSIPNSGRYALWRTMLRDVTELAGYDVEYLRRRYQRLVETTDESGRRGGDEKEEGGGKFLEETPGALPLLDSFEFEPDGGVAGLAYGIPGIADGSPVRTTAVADVTDTVPLGYVRTEDGTVAYELGLPAGELYSLGGTMTESMRRTMMEGVARTASSVVRVGGDVGDRALASTAAGVEMDGNLVNLAGTTAMALAGAAAVGMLSHHLTVNVFWV